MIYAGSCKKNGFSLVAVLLAGIVLVAIAAGSYTLLAQKSAGFPTLQQQKEVPATVNTEEIARQGTSDAVSAIQTDISATSFSDIDSDIISAEAELDAALSK